VTVGTTSPVAVSILYNPTGRDRTEQIEVKLETEHERPGGESKLINS
jgi:hypothetical protein